MKPLKHLEKIKQLDAAIDIAIAAFKNAPPKYFRQSDIDQAISSNLGWKQNISSPKYNDLKTLLQIEDFVFTFFQESNENTAEYFWQKIKEQGLDYRRTNKMAKILKRGKINNRIEYDFVIDVIVAYCQEGLITENESIDLGKMLYNFEAKHQKNS